MKRLNILTSWTGKTLVLVMSTVCFSQVSHAINIAAVTTSTDDGNVAENTIDGDLNTRWSANGDGQWIKFDLGANYTIDRFDIAFYHGDQRDSILDIAVSDDGESWNTVWTGTTENRTSEAITFDIDDTRGRYVQVIGHGNNKNSWNSLTEMNVIALPESNKANQSDKDTQKNLAGTYLLKNVGTNAYMASSDSNLYSRAEFTDNTMNNHSDTWELVPTGDYYFIRNTLTGYNLRPIDDTDFSPMQMTPSAWTGIWTQWSVSQVGDYYRLINRATGKFIRPMSESDNEMVQVPDTYTGTWTQYSLVEANDNDTVCELPIVDSIEVPQVLLTALDDLNAYMNDEVTLSDNKLKQYTAIIEENAIALGATSDVLSLAFAVVRQYEATKGPLFINAATAGGFSRAANLPLHQTMFALQQGLLDYGFADNNVERFQNVIEGANFETSAYFPGAIKAGAQINIAHTAKINASQPAFIGLPVAYYDTDARRPTGTYLPPGNVAVVTVPDELVGKGFSVRVGAQSWDLAKKSTVTRMDRVSLVYPITCKSTRIANPLGGGIYIDVPYEADAGIVDVSISNVTRSPFFSARSFAHTTSDKQWQAETEYGAPWADFESDQFMMQVPTAWLGRVTDPTQLMKDWDLAMSTYDELFGVISRSKTALYLQVDTVLRGGANFPGYPQSNYAYKPARPNATNVNQWLLKGPQYSDWATLHELGHAHLFTKFAGERESAVNLPFVAVMNDAFGVDLDNAYGNSISGMKRVSLDVGATMWMVTANFRAGNPMNISNVAGDEVKYQHRGHGKYVAIAKLFGWQALKDFWRSVNDDYVDGIKYRANADPIDSRILRMSRAAGVDLTPLIHFWGVQPRFSVRLAANIANEGLGKSSLIYDELQRYKSLIPLDNAKFKNHARVIYPNGLNAGRSALYGVGWYYVAAQSYSSTEGVAALAALQSIIDRYFPEGRP